MGTKFGAKLNEKYMQFDDDALIELVHQGDSEVLDYLIQKYRNFVRAKARSYFLNRC